MLCKLCFGPSLFGDGHSSANASPGDDFDRRRSLETRPPRVMRFALRSSMLGRDLHESLQPFVNNPFVCLPAALAEPLLIHPQPRKPEGKPMVASIIIKAREWPGQAPGDSSLAANNEAKKAANIL